MTQTWVLPNCDVASKRTVPEAGATAVTATATTGTVADPLLGTTATTVTTGITAVPLPAAPSEITTGITLPPADPLLRGTTETETVADPLQSTVEARRRITAVLRRDTEREMTTIAVACRHHRLMTTTMLTGNTNGELLVN